MLEGEKYKVPCVEERALTFSTKYLRKMEDLWVWCVSASLQSFLPVLTLRICLSAKMLEGCIRVLSAVALVDSWVLWKLARLDDETPSCNRHHDHKRQATG